MSFDSFSHTPTDIAPAVKFTGMTDLAVASSSITDKPNLDPMSPNDCQGQAIAHESCRHLSQNQTCVDGTKYQYGQWSVEKEKVIMGPYDYLLQHPEKDVRRQLINAFNVWLRVPPDSLAIINNVVAMLHTAFLL